MVPPNNERGIEEMKVLHYMFGIPPVRGGGLIRYATDLMKAEQKRGIQTVLLIPGKIPYNASQKIKIKRYGNYNGSVSYRIQNPLPIPMGNGILDIDAYTRAGGSREYSEFLKKLQPDLIHVHSLMGLQKEFLIEAQKLEIPVVFTTHDYFGLCPALNLMFGGDICQDKEWNYCELCCKNAYPMRKLQVEQSGLYRFYRMNEWIVRLFHQGMLKNSFSQVRAAEMVPVTEVLPEKKCKDYSVLRNYYREMFGLIDYFHFNSSLTREIYEERLGELPGKVVPVSHQGIGDFRTEHTYGKTLKLGYLGNWTINKGFYLLIQALDELQEEGYTDIELHIYSETEKRPEKYVRNHTNYSSEELPEVMNTFDVLVVPSLWKETYGLVVPEAISYGVPVIVSENVGAKDILEKHPQTGFIYDGSKDGLKQIITEIYRGRDVLTEANRAILSMDYDLSYDKHMENMLTLYRSILNS